MSNYSDSEYSGGPNTSWYKILQIIPAKAVVLDIGCSSGNFGEALKKQKKCVVDGIELDKQDAKAASKKLRQVWQLNIETDDIKAVPKSEYDIIYFGDVIEHLVDPITALKRIKPLLKADGKVVFSIPNMGHIGVRIDLLGGNFEYTETGLLDKTHLHFYTQSEVMRVFEEAGYSLDHLDFVEKDYPRKLLEKQLAKYGLKANDAFYKKMQETSASAFQFVGAAKVGKVKKHKLQTFGPIDLFENFYNDTVTNHQNEIKQLRQSNEELQRIAGKIQRRLHRRALRYVKRKLKS
jgi:2-polyprenyl-3-methyl-5-hydroxy-6-metoxy-1,4-benzoquinol methylase